MKLLVTGGAGFIGSAVVRQAIRAGHRIVNVDALTYAACLDNVASVSNAPSYVFEHADIRDRAALDRIFAAHTPDAVMHLAAESHVDRSIDGPGDFIETNITGTYHLLEAARSHWAGRGKPDSFRFHHISTDEVFGSLPADPQVQFTETTAYDPRSPYSASKAASDHLVRAWHETYGLPVVLTNCSNNYGPFHFPEKLIPVIILNALAGEPLPIYQIAFVADRPGHDARYAINPSRIRNELGWRPSVTVEQGLTLTVDWYLDNEEWWEPLKARHGVGQRLGVKV